MSQIKNLIDFLKDNKLSVVRLQPAVEDSISYYIPIQLKSRAESNMPELEKLAKETTAKLAEFGIAATVNHDGALKVVIEDGASVIEDNIAQFTAQNAINIVEPWLRRTGNATSGFSKG